MQIYSTDYVKGDRRYTHFFAVLTLFSAGDAVHGAGANMVQLILGWEIMGVCSFLLIGHWWEEKANSDAALKAFWTVRVGDIGLLVGTASLLGIVGTARHQRHQRGRRQRRVRPPDALCGRRRAVHRLHGKSGQFPLHTWLPDAMAGPTPVSALLHARTMVVAGVYLVARLYPVFFVGLEIHAVRAST